MIPDSASDHPGLKTGTLSATSFGGRRPLLALGLVTWLFASLSGCEKAGDAAPSAPSQAKGEATDVVVRLSPPEAVEHLPKAIATGPLQPEKSAQLAFTIPGKLLRIAVKEGQKVVSGQTLLILDTAAAEASVAQAEAGLSAAEAQLRMAQDVLDRLTPLREQQGVAEAQIVQVQSQKDLGAAQVAAARAQLTQARVHLSNHTLRAPFAGVVTRVPEGEGAAVNPGMPITAMEAVGTLLLQTSVTVGEAAGLVEGASVRVMAAEGGAIAENATVRTVVPSADPMTHRVPVQIAVPNPEGRFIAHGVARGEIAAGVPVKAWKLPAGCLTQKDGGFTVWSVGKDGKARKLPVTLLSQEGDHVVVVGAGLEGDIKVIDLPPAELREGTRVVGMTLTKS